MDQSIEELNRRLVNYGSRAGRQKFAYEHLSGYFGTSVLDVGCDDAVLRKKLPSNISYCGIDIQGDPDLLINLEERETLPFDGNSYETILCLDVLEHLDNLHTIFESLFQVASKNVIISWPNNWANARRRIERGYGQISHYGLPVEEPLDRHKWFFSLSEAFKFVRKNAKNIGYEIKQIFATEKERSLASRIPRRLYYSKKSYLNRYTRDLWTVLSPE